MSRRSRHRSSLYRLALIGLLAVTTIVVLTPIAYILVWAFKGTAVLGVLGPASLRWFDAYLGSNEWLEATGLAVLLSCLAASLGTVVAATIGFTVKRVDRRYEAAMTLIALLPLALPTLPYAFSLEFATARLPALLAVASLVVAEAVLLIPIQYLILRAAQARVAAVRLESALVLGASEWAAWRRVYMPEMRQAAMLAWAVGLFVAVDELVVTQALWRWAAEPLPLKLWHLNGRDFTPMPAVATLVVLGVVGVAVLGAAALRRTYAQLASRRPRQ